MAWPRPIVLILSSDPAFSRQLTEIWSSGADAPEFVILGQGLCHELHPDSYDLAIADVSSSDQPDSLKTMLMGSGKPAIMMSGELDVAPNTQSSIVEIPGGTKQWPATVVLVGREMLRRASAESRTRVSEHARAEAEAEATLGRYMVEMRNNVTNAITSVLGNAELLLLEPGLPAPVQAQADTIRNMALRLNEVFQRFSSIEKELNVAARESGKHLEQRRAAAGARE
jgi:signal transduction histidine kinase